MTKQQIRLVSGITMGLGISLVVLISLMHISTPPEVVSSEAPPGEFSARRASVHLPYIASEPNPTGSPANTRVRNYIVEQLQQMGLQPELHIEEYFFSDRAATLGNIIARMPGTGTGQAVLFMGHYDSVITAPGASDNGSAVITLLELIRLLQHHPPFENDFIFFFPDGEEYGLLGAQAFMARHHWAEDVFLVVNFEAMGTTGHSIMFETGNNNLEVVRQFAAVAPYPVANSLSVEIYNRMPNYTDFEVFKTMDYQGLNFAYIGNSFDYHTPGDNIANTDLRSIQHHGSYAKALALHFGNFSEDIHSGQDAVYFNTFGYRLVFYPYSWVPFITILALLMLTSIVASGLYRRKIRPWKTMGGFFSFAILLMLLYVVFHSLYVIIASYYPGISFRLIRYHQNGLILGFGLLAAAISMAFIMMVMRGVRVWFVLVLFASVVFLMIWSAEASFWKVVIALGASIWLLIFNSRPSGIMEVSAGIYLLWGLIAAIAGFMAPGASYLFIWPLVFLMLPFGVTMFKKENEEPGIFIGFLFLLLAIPVLSWFPQSVYLIQLAMGMPLSGIMMIIIGMMMGILAPHIFIMTREKRWLLPGLFFLAGTVFILINSVWLNYDERHRKLNQITYAVNGNTSESFLLTFDSEVDEWTEQFLTTGPDSVELYQFYPYHQGKAIGRQVNAVLPPPPVIELLSDSLYNGERILQLFVQSFTSPYEKTFFFKAGDSEVSVIIGDSGRHYLPRMGESLWHRLLYLAPPPEGITLTVIVDQDYPLELHFNEVDHSGLPDYIDYEPRPPYMMTRGDRTLNSYFYEF